jgi:hypothetical protein
MMVSLPYEVIDNVAWLDIEENKLVLDIGISHDPRPKEISRLDDVNYY